MAGPVSATQDGRLAIVAGSGVLPLRLAEAAKRAGQDPYIILLQAEADQDWSRFDHAAIGIGDLQGLKVILRDHDITRVVLSGGVKKRPSLRAIRPTLSALGRLPTIVSTLRRGGDDTVLRMVVALIESMGVQVVGAQQVAPDLVSHEGPLTTRLPAAADRADISAGARAAIALGRLDVGQAAVAIGGRVIALEGAEGTDEMIARVARLRAEGRLSSRREGVLVKFCKPQQDERVDLPSIGPSTIEGLRNAGLAGVAVEAGRSLILDRDAAIAAANAAGVFIAGILKPQAGEGGIDG